MSDDDDRASSSRPLLERLQGVLSPTQERLTRRLAGAQDQSTTEEETVLFEEEDRQQDILQEDPTTSNIMSSTSLSSSSASPIDKLFGSGTRLTADQIKNSMSVRSRNNRGTGKELQKLMESATYALNNKAGVRKEMVVHSRDGELEDGNISANEIGTAWEGSSRFVHELIVRVDTYDMASAINIPEIVDDSKDPHAGKWGGTVTNLCKQVMVVDLERIKEYTKDIIECDEEGDAGLARMDQKWLLQLVRKSCSTDLVDLVDRSFYKLDICYQGGSVYLKMVFDIIFAKSTKVVASLLKWIKNFEKKGLRKIPSNNVRLFAETASVICARLHEFGELPIDADIDILKGLTKCDCNEEFVNKFELYLTMSSQTLFNVSSPLDGKSTFEKIELFLDEAVDFWVAANINGEWKITNFHSANSCWLCGEDGHGVSECTEEYNQDTINKNKAKWLEKRGSKPAGTSGGTKSGGDKQHKYSRGKFSPPKAGETVRKINGTWYAACKCCKAWTTTHSSGSHEDWKDDSAFALPATHPLVMATSGTWKPPRSGKSSKQRRAKKEKQGTTPASSSSAGSSPAAGSSTNMMSALAKHMEKMETDSSDPRQAEMAGMIKALLSGKV